jgi:rubrerythrin
MDFFIFGLSNRRWSIVVQKLFGPKLDRNINYTDLIWKRASQKKLGNNTKIENKRPAAKPVENKKTEKKKFVCKKCGFNFSLNLKSHKIIECPWCGTFQ